MFALDATDPTVVEFDSLFYEDWFISNNQI